MITSAIFINWKLYWNSREPWNFTLFLSPCLFSPPSSFPQNVKETCSHKFTQSHTRSPTNRNKEQPVASAVAKSSRVCSRASFNLHIYF